MTGETENGYCLICKGTFELKIIYKIYANLGMSITYSDLLMKCFNIQFLDKHFGKDNLLCLKCIEKIKFCVNFRKQVETAHKLLYDIKPNLLRPKSVHSDSLKKLHLNEIQKRINEYKAMSGLEIKKKPGNSKKDSDDEPIVKYKSKNESESNLDNLSYDFDDRSNSSLAEESDSSVTTAEILRATGFKELIKKAREKDMFSIPKLEPAQKTCPVCDKQFPDSYLLKKHHVEHFPSFVCHFCGETFTKQFFFKVHINSHLERKFACDLCNKKYSTHEAMSKHRQINHFNHLPFVCFHCNKRFKYGLLKKKHLLSAHGVKCHMHKCPQCDQEFFTAHVMESHLKKKHFQMKEHKCCACSAAFYSERDLKKHYLVKHEGIKSHKCEICNKSFSYSRGLRTHRKIHLNQRDHVCQMCGADFVQITSLKYHIRTHHKEVAE